MPIYEYQCRSCEHQFEKLQKMSDEPLKDCPQCQQPELKKLISAAGFQLKGSGWYETDFKNKKKASSDNQKTSSDTAEKSNTSKSTPSSKSTAA